jgi:hypothetical protein
MRKLLPWLLLLAAIPAAHAGARPASSDLSPDRVFAADLIARHRAGWRLADVAVDYAMDEDEGSVAMSILLVRGEQAERFRLRFGEYGEVPVGYERAPEAVPSERRVYASEPDLFALLAGGGSLRLYDECGVPFLSGSRASVALYDGAWYVVTASESGRAAQEKLASLLASSLGAGMDLTRVEAIDDEVVAGGPEPAPPVGGAARARSRPSIDEEGGRVIELALVGDETLTVRVTVDEGGEVVSFEARRSPGASAWSRIRGAGKLARALRATTAVRAMVIRGDDPKLILGLESNQRVLIRLEDVEQLDSTEEEGCGC